MVLWDYFASFFKDDSESLDAQRSEQDYDKNNEDVDIYNNSVHKLKLFAFLSKKEGADFNAIDSSGWSPILRAIAIDNVEIVKLLILKSKGVDLNAPSYRQHTPLTYAIFNEKLEIVEELIKSGANVDQKDDQDWTPLIAAIHKNNLKIVILLATNRANFNSIYFGWTPLIIAIRVFKCSIEMVECLIKSGADVNQEDNNGWTPFKAAIATQNLEITRLLATNGANINFIDSGGSTPIADALGIQNMEIVRCLVENGADVNIHNGNGGTAFHETIKQKDTKMFNYFLNNGANIDVRTANLRNNSLELAMKPNRTNMLKQLIYHLEND